MVDTASGAMVTPNKPATEAPIDQFTLPTAQAPPNKGIDTRTGQQVPVIEIKPENNPNVSLQPRPQADTENIINIQRQIRGETALKNIPNPVVPEVKTLLDKNPVVNPTLSNAQNPQDVARAFIAPSVDFFTTIKDVLLSKKPIKVQEAQSSFDSVISELGKQNSLIATGDMEINQALANLDLGAQALNRLEATQKGLGKANLRYWLTDGKEVESMIIQNKLALERARTELLLSAQQGRQAKAQRAVESGIIPQAPPIRGAGR